MQQASRQRSWVHLGKTPLACVPRGGQPLRVQAVTARARETARGRFDSERKICSDLSIAKSCVPAMILNGIFLPLSLSPSLLSGLPHQR